MVTKTLVRAYGWAAIAVAVPVGVCLATAAVMSIPPSRGPIDPVAGRALFQIHCRGCHFTTPGFPSHPGPNLFEIGKTAASRRPNQSASEYLLESILEPAAFTAPGGRPGMPKNVVAHLSPADMRNVVAFLADCGAFPDYDEIRSLEIPDLRSQQQPRVPVRLQDMMLAERVMRDKGRCLECHALHNRPEYKAIAPAIFGAGLIDRDLLNRSIVEPHEEVLSTYRSVIVSLENGQILNGRLLYRTAHRLALLILDDNGKLTKREIPLSEVEQEDGELLILESSESMMPSGFDQLLTREELEAVITLIRQLN